MATQLFVDSTAYLSAKALEDYQIKVLSLSVHFEGEGADQNEDILESTADYDYFYKKLAQSQAKTLPTSSQPNPHAMEQAFIGALEQGMDLFVVTLSAEMSGTYQTVCMLLEALKDQYPQRQMTVVDSRSNCMQLGFQALSAARSLREHSELSAVQSHEAAVAAVLKTQNASRFIFIADTLKYLEKGGRIGRASAFLGTLLSIKPVLTVNDGRTDAMGKVRTRQKALEYLANHVARDVEAHGFERACIHHIHNPEGVQALIAALPEEVAKAIPIVSIGPVIGTHVGPGAVGIVYETKEPLR